MRPLVALLSLGLVNGCSASHDDDPATKPNVPPVNVEANFAWRAAAPCPVPRFEALGVIVADEVWVMGGFLSRQLDVTERVDIYDPHADSWRLGPDLPGAQTHAGVVNVNGDIIVAGGFVGNVQARTTTAAVWRYSAKDAMGSSAPDLPTWRAAMSMALVGSEIHAAGGLAEDGNTDSDEHVVLDLAGTGDWTTAPPLAVARNHGGGASSGGLFFAVAGRHAWDEVAGDEPLLDAFDPVTDAWQERASMTVPRSEIGASTGVTSDGRLLVIGGSIPGPLPSASVLLYDPRANTWSSLPSLPQALKGAVAARVGTQVIVTTGSPTSTDPSATTYVGCCL